jgi:PAS domain S-box-containing protein
MKTPSILIVEDEAIVAADLAIRLTQLGYEVVGTTPSGEESVVLAERTRPSLVLMDIRLQGALDGIEAAQEIRARFRLPVVFLTAYAESATLQRAKLAEPLGYILKPFEDRELATIVEIALYKHQTECRLQESEERFRTLAALAPAGIYLADLEGRCHYANERWCEIAGLSLEAALGDGWVQGLHPEDRASVRAHWQQMVASAGHWGLEYRFQTPAGKTTWVYGQANAQRDKWGNVTGYIGVNIDITERKRAEAEKAVLEAQNRRLQKAESLGRMAGAIAHHFNNQLQGVMGNLELAWHALPPQSAAAENLTAALKSARKAAEVSGLMLTYLGQTHGRLAALDLSETCRQYLPMLLASLPEKVTLETDFAAPGPVVNANASQLHQVLINLVTNAWEASHDQAKAIRLRIKTVPAADIPTLNRYPVDHRPLATPHACLEVADSGCGIAPADLEKLFDPFFSSKFVGRGMGLPVALGIVQAHGGAITVESVPGRGTTMRVFLPTTVETVPQPAAPPLPAPPPAKASEGTAVLVVEDEPSVRRTVTLALQYLGFTVLAAEDGLEALELFRRHRDEVGCVLCDLTMPRMSGWDTLTALREMAPGFPVILASGYSEAQVMSGEHPELPQAFLGKPYELATLNATLARVMTGSAAAKQTPEAK